ncbi:hypothetical protein [Kiloniella sp. EL199]|uniref:hypothetical protein n=1 Tax=Kiloniella sp. EL199 TaxID=2107581 RepID=UPI000EA24DBB|nr:hypothetical protein [Kiloniella sp. EL199]
MNKMTQNIKDFDLAAVDMSVHFQTARKARSAEAHKLFKAIFSSLTSPVSNWKTRYILALSRTA